MPVHCLVLPDEVYFHIVICFVCLDFERKKGRWKIFTSYFPQYKLEPTPEPSDEEEDSSEEEEEAFGGGKKKKEEEDPAASEQILTCLNFLRWVCWGVGGMICLFDQFLPFHN